MKVRYFLNKGKVEQIKGVLDASESTRNIKVIGIINPASKSEIR